MAKSTGTYVLVAVLAIPAITLAVLIWLGSVFVMWYDFILPVFVVYLVALIGNIITRKACGKRVGNWRKMVGFLFIKTILFTFGIIGMIAYIVSGGAALVSVQLPNIIINALYLVTLVVAWAIMAIVNEVMIK